MKYIDILLQECPQTKWSVLTLEKSVEHGTPVHRYQQGMVQEQMMKQPRHWGQNITMDGWLIFGGKANFFTGI